MDIKFITSFSIVTAHPADDQRLFRDALGLPLEPPATQPGSDYLFTERIDGAKHFGVWPLAEAAEACFGTPEWPPGRPVPQVSIEFDVADAEAVSAAAAELEQAGYELLHPAREEPWGQTVARVQSLEGAIIGISYAPALH